MRANEYTNNVLNQLSLNSFKGCFFDDLINIMGFRSQLSYSLKQMTPIVNQQVAELERLKEIRKVERQTTESNKIMTLFEISSPIERRAALIQELWPSKAA